MHTHTHTYVYAWEIKYLENCYHHKLGQWVTPEVFLLAPTAQSLLSPDPLPHTSLHPTQGLDHLLASK